MAEILSYLLFGFSIVTLIMALGVVRKRASGREKIMCFPVFAGEVPYGVCALALF